MSPRYMDNIILHPDHVTQLASPATRGLSTWLHTAYTYQTLCNVLNVETSIDFRLPDIIYIFLLPVINLSFIDAFPHAFC